MPTEKFWIELEVRKEPNDLKFEDIKAHLKREFAPGTGFEVLDEQGSLLGEYQLAVPAKVWHDDDIWTRTIEPD